MAQVKKAVSFKNAVINMDDYTITEFGKDDTKVYRLGDVLRDWHNVEGVTFTIQQTEELPAMNDQEDDC